MKRSAALAPLSRDHQHALDAALRLRRAEEDTRAAALTYFADFFAREGRRHFEIEEELILPALPDEGDWGDACARVKADHAAIRAAADADELDLDATRALGERLNDHVRFEERTQFPMLEEHLDEATLTRLGQAIEVAERRTV